MTQEQEEFVIAEDYAVALQEEYSKHKPCSYCGELMNSTLIPEHEEHCKVETDYAYSMLTK